MTNAINPAGGPPVPRTSSDKPKTPEASAEKFSVPSSDTVQTSSSSSLSFGSLRPLINTHLTNETAISAAEQTGKQLGSQSLPVVNNRPQVVTNLVESHDKAHG
ncbi:MAG TPA: hypothetical protein VGB82_26275 [Alphaproteobacteria bacterium]